LRCLCPRQCQCQNVPKKPVELRNFLGRIRSVEARLVHRARGGRLIPMCFLTSRQPAPCESFTFESPSHPTGVPKRFMHVLWNCDPGRTGLPFAGNDHPATDQIWSPFRLKPSIAERLCNALPVRNLYVIDERTISNSEEHLALRITFTQRSIRKDWPFILPEVMGDFSLYQLPCGA
jgi:hypothetical protein